MNDVKLDLRNLGVKMKTTRIVIEQKGEPRPSCSVVVLNKKKKENIICGRHVASMWRITTNQKLREMIKDLDIVADNKNKIF
jgi:hypothetical protein